MSEEPNNINEKILFITDDKKRAEAIINIDIKCIFLAEKDNEYEYNIDTLIDYFNSIIYTGKYRNDYIYALACITKKNNNRLESYFKAENLANYPGWEIFYNKEYLANKEYEEKLKEEIEGFIKRFTGNKQKYNTNLPKLISMDEVEEKEVEWLVPQYMPKGHINIMAGDVGVGKTTIWCGIVAALSSGNKIFFEAVPDEFIEREPQKIIFFSSEDSMEYTLKKKFRKYNANMKNILSLSIKDGAFKDIKFNSPVLRKLIKHEKPAFIVFDPIQSFIPPNMNMGKRNEMRDCLNCLRELGEEFRCTFLIICHTNKQSGVYGRRRISDSADIWDIARSVLIVGQTQDGKRYLSQEKNSYDQEAETVIYTVNDGIAVFEEYSDKKDRDFVQERDYNTRQAPQRADAEHFIYEFLRNGKKPTKELDEAAESGGISRNTLKRAKTDLRNRGLLGRSEGYGKNKVFYSYIIDPLA